MNKSAWLLIVFICAAFTCTGNIIKVGRQQEVATIRQAIQLAMDGDTVLVEAGLYREKNIIIVKPLALLGEGSPVLDGEYTYEILSVKANNVTVKGFTIIHSGISSLEDIAGIKIYNARNVVISGNVLINNFFGIYNQGGTHCRIENNKLTASSKTDQQSGNGIHCWKSDSLVISGNEISGHRDGIYFEFVTNSIIWKNISSGNIRYGLHFMFSHYDSYVSNIFRNNGAGVSVMFTHGVTMINNFFEHNWGDGAFGLLLKEISDSFISGNKFLNNTSGIFMEGATRVRIEKNEFKNNGWALKIQASCMDDTITNNNFISNTFDVGTNGSLVLNCFDRNYWDKYEGYDLRKDNTGDIPFYPVSLFSIIVERNPPAMMLFRSFMVSLLDKTERLLPTLTPENLRDDFPYMKPLRL